MIEVVVYDRLSYIILPIRWLQAQARQQQFAQSAVGRAALKAVKDAKKQDAREAGGSSARDWLS